jgi:hypothetical protein
MEKVLQINKNWNEDEWAMRETNNEKNSIGQVEFLIYIMFNLKDMEKMWQKGFKTSLCQKEVPKEKKRKVKEVKGLGFKPRPFPYTKCFIKVVHVDLTTF